MPKQASAPQTHLNRPPPPTTKYKTPTTKASKPNICLKLSHCIYMWWTAYRCCICTHTRTHTTRCGNKIGRSRSHISHTLAYANEQHTQPPARHKVVALVRGLVHTVQPQTRHATACTVASCDMDCGPVNMTPAYNTNCYNQPSLMTLHASKSSITSWSSSPDGSGHINRQSTP
jgi:hypothetical protein